MLRFAFESLEAAVLFGVAALALANVRYDRSRFSLVAGLGTLYLAFDEVLNLHERLGRVFYNDFGWGDPPLVNHWDDVFLGLVGLGGLLIVAVFWRRIVADARFAVIFTLGLAFFAAAVSVDVMADPTATVNWWTEESLELAGAAAMCAAFTFRLRQLRRNSG